ncbi:MAG: hypothetical protein AAF804_16550 [Bacteroidota bacterium]
MLIFFLANPSKIIYVSGLIFVLSWNSGLAQRESLSFIAGEIDENPGIDSVAIYRSSGSMAAWRQVSIKSGNSPKPLEMGYTFFYSNFSNTLVLPKAWSLGAWQAYHPIVDSIFGFEEQRLTGKEADLRWLLDAFDQQQEGDTTFHRYFNVPLNWQPLPFKEPVNGWYLLPEAKAQPLLTGGDPELNDENAKSDSSQVWLDYRGQNHFLAWRGGLSPKGDTSFRRVWKSRKKRLWRTAHGLIWQQGNQYAWVFVSSGNLMGGPQKLRWESIVQTQVLEKRYVLLHQAAPVIQWNQLFLIDTQTGRVGDIRLDQEIKIGATSALKFKLKGDQLIIQRSESKYVDESYEAILDWRELKQTLGKP